MCRGFCMKVKSELVHDLGLLACWAYTRFLVALILVNIRHWRIQEWDIVYAQGF